MTHWRPSIHLWKVGADISSLRHLSVVMVQSRQNWNSNRLGSCLRSGTRCSRGVGDPLLDPLMRSCLVEVDHIAIEHVLELPLMQNQQVIEAFLPHTPQESLTDGIGSRRVIGSFENLDATCPRHTSKARPKFAIVITNQVLWCLPIRGRFSELLGYPGLGRRACHADMDDLA